MYLPQFGDEGFGLGFSVEFYGSYFDSSSVNVEAGEQRPEKIPVSARTITEPKMYHPVNFLLNPNVKTRYSTNIKSNGCRYTQTNPKEEPIYCC